MGVTWGWWGFGPFSIGSQGTRQTLEEKGNSSFRNYAEHWQVKVMLHKRHSRSRHTSLGKLFKDDR